MVEVKKVIGVFMGVYCVNLFNDEVILIYIVDYVLVGYGIGVVMVVFFGDQCDWNFVIYFDLLIILILDGQGDIEEVVDFIKEGKYINFGFINGLIYEEVVLKLISWLEECGIGWGKVQYCLCNVVFSCQCYWGELVLVYWKDDVLYLVLEEELLLVLLVVDKYLFIEIGELLLGCVEDWKFQGKYDYELSIMLGWVGFSWYWYCYMDL